MDTMPTFDASRRNSPPMAPPLPRPVPAATVVAALYVLLALSTPWIIRYAPGFESQVAAQIAEHPGLLRCASAPEYGLPCGAPVRDGATVAAHA